MLERGIKGMDLISGDRVVLPVVHLFAEDDISGMMDTFRNWVKDFIRIARVSKGSTHINHLRSSIV